MHLPDKHKLQELHNMQIYLHLQPLHHYSRAGTLPITIPLASLSISSKVQTRRSKFPFLCFGPKFKIKRSQGTLETIIIPGEKHILKKSSDDTGSNDDPSFVLSPFDWVSRHHIAVQQFWLWRWTKIWQLFFRLWSNNS